MSVFIIFTLAVFVAVTLLDKGIHAITQMIHQKVPFQEVVIIITKHGDCFR